MPLTQRGFSFAVFPSSAEMAFSAYCGTTGEGKTYEVVENVVVKSIGEGRRVLTNISGLNVDKIHAYLISQGKDPELFGEIVKLPPIEKCAGKFATIEELEGAGEGETSARLLHGESLIREGDVVVLDEVWRIWKRGAKIDPKDEFFWRMHRHLAHPETGVTTDIVVITQNWSSLHQTLRDLVHQRFHMKKHTALGFTKRYVVGIYAQGERKPHIQLQRTYRKEIFELYKSNSMSDSVGQDKQIDDRGNLLKHLLKTTVPLLVLFFIVGGGYLYWFFTEPEREANKAKAAAGAPSAATTSSQANAPVVTRVAQTAQEGREEALAKLSPWRVTGYAATPTNIILFVDIEGTGLRQVIAPADTVVNGQYVEVELDGKLFGTMSGHNTKNGAQSFNAAR